MNILFLLLLAYLIYRFVGGFLIPVLRTSRQMRQQFQNMNRPSGTQTDFSGTGYTTRPESPKAETPKKESSAKGGEYIDFEEVR